MSINITSMLPKEEDIYDINVINNIFKKIQTDVNNTITNVTSLNIDDVDSRNSIVFNCDNTNNTITGTLPSNISTKFQLIILSKTNETNKINTQILIDLNTENKVFIRYYIDSWSQWKLISNEITATGNNSFHGNNLFSGDLTEFSSFVRFLQSIELGSSSSINVNGCQLRGLRLPKNNDEAATKEYVDSHSSGGDSGTGDVTLAGNNNFTGKNTFNGYVEFNGDNSSTGNSVYISNGLSVGSDNFKIDKLGTVNLNNHQIKNLATPTNDTDAATKKYVDDSNINNRAAYGLYSMLDTFTVSLIDEETEIKVALLNNGAIMLTSVYNTDNVGLYNYNLNFSENSRNILIDFAIKSKLISNESEANKLVILPTDHVPRDNKALPSIYDTISVASRYNIIGYLSIDYVGNIVYN